MSKEVVPTWENVTLPVSAFHSLGALVLTAGEPLLLIGVRLLPLAAVPLSALDVQLGEVAVAGDPYHLRGVSQSAQVSRFRFAFLYRDNKLDIGNVLCQFC